MNTKEIGNLTELQCITGLYSLGCNISIPFGNSQKYDLIMDYKGKLYKIQVKHSQDGFTDDILTHFSFKTKWVGHNNNDYNENTYSIEDIDYFATFHHGEVYLIPVEECLGASKTLRYFPPKNNQKKGVSFAKDYLASKVLKELQG